MNNKKVIETIDKEIKDCQTLKRLTEKRLLLAKTNKDYKCIISNMQSVLENNYAMYRLKKLRERFEESGGEE